MFLNYIMESITTKIILKPTYPDNERRFLTSIKSGKLVYSYSDDFFKLSDLSDVKVSTTTPQRGEVLTYTTASNSKHWTNKTHNIKKPPMKTFQHVSVDRLQIKEYTHTTPKIRVKTTHVFTIHNDRVCRDSLIFISAVGGVAAAVNCIQDGLFEVILVNYNPEQKVKKDEYKISYFIINR